MHAHINPSSPYTYRNTQKRRVCVCVCVCVCVFVCVRERERERDLINIYAEDETDLIPL